MPPAGSAADGAALVRLTDVAKVFPNGTRALDGLSLSVHPGELAALLGPSGCGKSTVLRLIAGLDEPSAGTVERAEAAGRAPGRDIGFVFQDPTLMPWATAVANVALPLRLAGVPKREAARRSAEALARVGLSGAGGAFPRQLSGGMRMRVSIARALVARPRLLLMDEPFAALDEITRFRLNDDLLGLWRDEGWTGVFVTHSVAEAVFLSTRVLVMSPGPGRIVEEVPVDLPHPRGEALRTAAPYVALCARVSASLRRAMGAAPDGRVRP